jgi:hypothetical protein
MRVAAETLSRLARSVVFVAVFLPGGTVDLLPAALGRSCAHECCRRTDACHRRSASRVEASRVEESSALSARHVLDGRCRDLCGLLQTASASLLASSLTGPESAPPPPAAILFGEERAPRFVDASRVASPRGPPSFFS